MGTQFSLLSLLGPGKAPDDPVRRDATLSACGTYRYTLTRAWGDGGSCVLWVLLNPSTADATQDDATLRRVLGYSRAWGYDALAVVNLYAYRATDPAALLEVLHRDTARAVGLLCDAAIATRAASAALIVVGWGGKVRDPARVARVVNLLRGDGARTLYALRVNTDGSPAHPLYLPGHLVPQPWYPR